MGDKSGIEWTEATWNPVTGCSKVSPGCAHCYAETLALTRLAGKPGYPGLPWTPENAEANVVLRPDRLDQPLRWKRPRMIFVNSMSDLFHEQVPDEFIARVFYVMRRAKQHTFQVLTKRPERMCDLVYRLALEQEFSDTFDACPPMHPYPNIWLGVSIENHRYVGRADVLRATPAAVRFISAEPLLGPLLYDSEEGTGSHYAYEGPRTGSTEIMQPAWADGYDGPELDLTGIDWLIVGGESGSEHRPMRVEWVRDLRNACRCYICGGRGRRSSWVNELGREVEGECPDCHGTGNLVAFFFKQDSGLRAGRRGRFADEREWPREMPVEASKETTG